MINPFIALQVFWVTVLLAALYRRSARAAWNAFLAAGAARRALRGRLPATALPVHPGLQTQPAAIADPR